MDKDYRTNLGGHEKGIRPVRPDRGLPVATENSLFFLRQAVFCSLCLPLLTGCQVLGLNLFPAKIESGV